VIWRSRTTVFGRGLGDAARPPAQSIIKTSPCQPQLAVEARTLFHGSLNSNRPAIEAVIEDEDGFFTPTHTVCSV